ncbi:sugar ABC transporter ATP-binding protein [Microbacterium profundi]|uniref:sugar ABC transporter ATP-binding protein n=1 Tax=Microbacterium profundi TaxID=450380 RepID=UPI001F3116D8|nr:sugar ABC transporter ATP-binding protein [Microbacterium profundi]MCE7482213.1 sugar ABC transporter ATP-binding protein [Microbacterium profundi]
MPDTVLRMSGVTKRFRGVTALDDVSLEVRRGEVHAICGENGAGKSTLMEILSGVHPHGTFEGKIAFDGRDMQFRSLADSESEGIVIVHQELAVVPQLSIAENIFLGHEMTRFGLVDEERTHARAAELMARVGLRESPATRMSELGIGKQQLVEIAKALAKDVRLLILDEPTAALGRDDSDRLMALVDRFRSQGITCVLISHKLQEVLDIADRITVLRDGASIETTRRDDPETDESRIIRAMVGRPLDDLFPPREPDIGDELFRVEHWTVRHPSDPQRVVIDDVSFHVNSGEIVGIAGLMGAGRTELAMSIFGHSYGSTITGTAYKRGEQIELHTIRDAIGHGIAYAPEDRRQDGLNLLASVQTSISSVALGRLAHHGLVDGVRERKVAEAYRYKMNIKTHSVSAATATLSGGNQQKIVLSKWIFSNPEVLILDEPTRGIDVGAKYEIYGLINELAAQGKSIIVISSELPEVIGLSDRVYTLADGRITAEVTRADATQELLMRHMTAVR